MYKLCTKYNLQLKYRVFKKGVDTQQFQDIQKNIMYVVYYMVCKSWKETINVCKIKRLVLKYLNILLLYQQEEHTYIVVLLTHLGTPVALPHLGLNLIGKDH